MGHSWEGYYLIHLEQKINRMMKTENIIIANLSCGGCIKTITKKVTALSGVTNVTVDLETTTVTVDFDAPPLEPLFARIY